MVYPTVDMLTDVFQVILFLICFAFDFCNCAIATFQRKINHSMLKMDPFHIHLLNKSILNS